MAEYSHPSRTGGLSKALSGIRGLDEVTRGGPSESGRRISRFAKSALHTRSDGTAGALAVLPMAEHSFRDIHAWQLANELKAGIFQLVRPTAAEDARLRNRLQQAAASAPRAIADGLGPVPPCDARECLRAANGSLMEASLHLQEGLKRGYFSASEVEPLLFLARRASAATTSLARYIDVAAVTRCAAG